MWMPRSVLPPSLANMNTMNTAATGPSPIPPPGASINASLHNPSLASSFGTMGSFGFPQPPPNPQNAQNSANAQAALATRELQRQITAQHQTFNAQFSQQVYRQQQQYPQQQQQQQQYSSSSNVQSGGSYTSYSSYSNRPVIVMKLQSNKSITLQVHSCYGHDSSKTMPPNKASYRGDLGGVRGLNEDLSNSSSQSYNLAKKFRLLSKDASGGQKITYDSDENRWNVPFELHDVVNSFFQTDVNCQKIGLIVDPIPREALNALFILKGKSSSSEVSVEEVVGLGLDLELAKKLSPYQRTGVKFVADRKGVALIADEMGLGKTVQAVASSSLFKNLWPVLVVCPSGARYHWRKEYELWLEGTKVQVINTGSEEIDKRADVVVLSYGLVTSLVGSGRLCEGNFKCVIVDESHMLKNPAAKRTKALLPVLLKAEARILLSGTPAFARPLELFTQLNAVSNENSFKLFRDQKSFKKRYCDGEDENSSELHLMLKECMIRRLKKDVLKQLKKKERVIVKYEKEGGWGEDVVNGMKKLRKGKGKMANIAVEQWEAENSSSSSSESSDDELASLDSEQAQKRKRRNVLMKLYNDTGVAKIPYVLRHLDSTQDPSPSKIIVFAHHQAVLDAVEKRCRSESYRYIRIDGKTSPLKRTEMTSKYQDDPKVTVAILSITAAGVAITLTAAHRVIFAELFWTPGLMLQAEDRCHRIGQARDVMIKYIIGVGTVDEVIWELAKRKFKSLGEFVEGKEGMSIRASEGGGEDFDWDFRAKLDVEGKEGGIAEEDIDDDLEEIIRTLGEEEKKAAGLEDEGIEESRTPTPSSFKKAVPDEIICLDDSDNEIKVAKRGTAADPVMLDDSDDDESKLEREPKPKPTLKRQRQSPTPYRLYTHAIETTFLGIVVRFEPSSTSAMPQVTVTSISEKKPNKTLPHINDCLLSINGQSIHNFPTLPDLKKEIGGLPRPLQLTFLTYGKTELVTVNGVSCMKAKPPPLDILQETQRQVMMESQSRRQQSP
ncbi:hypothetical protein TrVE_jg4166 [Triparma verrucosa]|uniref:Uncharacterized protein n=1 Tax=Triparma verrucosa TaxID=1606542 RepID=A0A9W7BNK7_9STRA|nr:hypothetical protein TrVE_jg4166 [Triparma verrucosa]